MPTTDDITGIMHSMKIASRLVAWQRVHGRHGLPWQQTHDPYRVWLSEIMLQQTQVTAVMPYYAAFLSRFPDVESLASAPAQEVMALWAGLGYYARARNLHACAQAVMRDWNGEFPPDAAGLASLPGIGPSTAAAIASFCYAERAAILDGNVKRVLARYFAVDGDPTTRVIEQQLWQHARDELPTAAQVQRDPDMMSAYTQGLMDLGATVCTRARPQCLACPLKTGCAAFTQGRCDELPWPRARKALPERSINMLIVAHSAKILLEQRPDSGIWGGLWSLPEFDAQLDAESGCALFGIQTTQIQRLSPFLHTFTHYRLTIQPLLVHAQTAMFKAPTTNIAASWIPLSKLASLGMPAPVRKLLDGLLADNLLA